MIYAFEIKRGKFSRDTGVTSLDEAIRFHGCFQTKGEGLRETGNALMRSEGHLGNWRGRLANCIFITKEEGCNMKWINRIGYPEASS